MKLVRDKIPKIIRESGRTCDYHVASEAELKAALFDKLREELNEFIATPCLEEGADMYEVLLAIFEIHNFKLLDVMRAASDKEIERGSFELGIILDRYDAPSR